MNSNVLLYFHETGKAESEECGSLCPLWLCQLSDSITFQCESEHKEAIWLEKSPHVIWVEKTKAF